MDSERAQTRRYHHGDLRHALIQAGLELLAEGGSTTLDLRKVARKAGVSHAAPYRHFADKQALIVAITEEGFHQLAQRAQEMVQAAPDDALAQLQAVALAYVRFAEENPWLMREMFSGITIEREAHADLYHASKTVYAIYVDILERGQEQGTIIEIDPKPLAGVLWAMLHGVAMLTIENQVRAYAQGPEGVASMTRFSIQMLFEGLGRSADTH